jgi:hypothetical protein
VTRTARTESSGWNQKIGDISTSGTTRWKERVPVIRSTYRVEYRCCYCGHMTEKVEEDQREDFSRN